MLEVLQFIFSSFWVWLGTVIILGVIGDGLHGVFRRSARKKDDN